MPVGKLTGIIFLYPQPDTMTTQLTPQQAALQRLDDMLEKTSRLHASANSILDIALNDAVALQKFNNDAGFDDVNNPVILSEDGIVCITRLRNDLGDLVSHYTKQREQFTASLNAIAERNTPSAEVAPVDTVESLRERIERIASEDVGSVEAVLEQGPHVHKTIRQDRNEVLAAASKLAMGLDPAQRIAKPDILQSALPAIDLNKDDAAPLRPLENSIMRLLGPNSPLLDIFMMSPWLENGKGFVTVGTPGFNWYKGTDPMEREPATRASLPSGFYFGEDVPKYAILRMSKCIIIWGFELEPESMSVYIAGTSDANPDSVRWFKPSDLAASHTRQLIGELLEAVEKYKPVTN